MTLITSIGVSIILRKIIGISTFLVLLVVVVFLVGSHSLNYTQQLMAANSSIKAEQSWFNQKGKTGKITIINMDANTQFPIKDTEYAIIKTETDEIVDIVTTDLTGKAVTDPLDYGNYKIIQNNIINPYMLDSNEVAVNINSKNNEVISENKMVEYVKNFVRTEEGEIKVTEVFIPVKKVLQLPELPNGCEITTLTAVLNYYGYDVTKTTMADNYLRKEPFVKKGNKQYGANPFKAYAGDPRSIAGGFFSYAPPIMEAANKYFHDVGGNGHTLDISGSTREEIIGLIDKGIPVMVWITLDLSKPKINSSWYFHDTNKKFNSPTNLHTVVLNGYDGKDVHAMNPLVGQIKYNADAFFKSYEELGSHSMIVVEEEGKIASSR